MESKTGVHKPNTESEKQERSKKAKQISKRMARNPLRLKPLPFILKPPLLLRHGAQRLQSATNKAPVQIRELSSKQIHVRDYTKTRLQATVCHMVPFTDLTG